MFTVINQNLIDAHTPNIDHQYMTFSNLNNVKK